MTQSIILVGAGPVGCVMALALVGRGFRVTVLEKRPDPRDVPAPRGRSTHIVISRRGWTALESVGAKSKVEDISLPLAGRMIHPKGAAEHVQPYSRRDEQILAVQRDELSRELLEMCRVHELVDLKFNVELQFLDTQAARVSILHEGVIRSLKGALVIASDGANSSVRSALEQAGKITVERQTSDFGYFEVPIPKGVAERLSNRYMHAWPRGRTSLFAFPNRDGSFTGTVVAPSAGAAGLRNLKTLTGARAWVSGEIATVGWDWAGLPESIAAASPSYLTSVRCQPWRVGGCVLFGDAAHAMFPFLGQGLNTGLEDVHEFMRVFDQTKDLALALDAHATLRPPNSDAITRMSARAFFELTAEIGQDEYHKQQQIMAALSERFPDFFSLPYEMLAFSRLPFVLVESRARALQGIARQIRDELGDDFQTCLTMPPTAIYERFGTEGELQ